MDQLYSVTLLLSLLSGAAALIAGVVRHMRPAEPQRWSRVAVWASVVAWLAVLVSFSVHLVWGHTPGGPSALAPWQFIRAHVSFVVAAALPTVAVLLTAKGWKRARD